MPVLPGVSVHLHHFHALHLSDADALDSDPGSTTTTTVVISKRIHCQLPLTPRNSERRLPSGTTLFTAGRPLLQTDVGFDIINCIRLGSLYTCTFGVASVCTGM